MAEDDVEHAFLGVVEIEQARQQQRPHFGNGGPHRMALFAIEIPEDHRIIGIGIILHAQFPGPPFQLVGVLECRRAGHGYAGQVALHVGHEHRHAGSGEAFRHALQGHRLAGAGGARDQPVAIGPPQLQGLPVALQVVTEKNVAHACAFACCVFPSSTVAQAPIAGQAIDMER